jgi:hypothetical protein
MKFSLAGTAAMLAFLSGGSPLRRANHAPRPPHPAPPRISPPRASHLLPLHRRERPDHHPTGPNRRQPAIQIGRALPPGRRAPGRHLHRFDLDVHLRPAEQQIAVRALLTVRNDGKTPLARIRCKSPPRSTGSGFASAKTLPFQVATLNSDADHTGQLHEAPSRLPSRSRPASLQLDVTYSGAIPLRPALLAIGTPDDVALHSDWDQIGLPFTGLRGFGNVVWYPVPASPSSWATARVSSTKWASTSCGCPARASACASPSSFPTARRPPSPSSTAIGAAHRHRARRSRPELRRWPAWPRPDSRQRDPRLRSSQPLCRHSAPHPGPNLTAWTLPEDKVAVEFWTTRQTAVTPFLQGWLGQKPRSQLTLLDLPDPEDAPFETGALLAAPLREPGPKARFRAH